MCCMYSQRSKAEGKGINIVLIVRIFLIRLILNKLSVCKFAGYTPRYLSCHSRFCNRQKGDQSCPNPSTGDLCSLAGLHHWLSCIEGRGSLCDFLKFRKASTLKVHPEKAEIMSTPSLSLLP